MLWQFAWEVFFLLLTVTHGRHLTLRQIFIQCSCAFRVEAVSCGRIHLEFYFGRFCCVAVTRGVGVSRFWRLHAIFFVLRCASSAL